MRDTYGDWGGDVLDIRFLQQDVPCHVAEFSHFRFFDALAVLEQFDLAVEIVVLLKPKLA